MITSTTRDQRAKEAHAAWVAASIAAAGPRDWTEDFAHDNGQYMNACSNCKHVFIGYKRRVVCKLCARPTP